MGCYLMINDFDRCGEPCDICGKAVEYGQKFYFHPDGSVTHALCTWKEIDRERETMAGDGK